MRSFNARATAVILASALLYTHSTAQGQDSTTWNGKRCAIVLTYDDALNVHLDNAVPLLDSLGLKATFYLSGFFPGFRERVNDWVAVAKEGHELGNHTLFHPCESTAPGREWVKPEYALNTYTPKRILDEITMANTLLNVMDGKTERTFAYPCGDMKAGDSSYVGAIKKYFVGARSVDARMQTIEQVDLFDIHGFMVNGQTGEQLIGLVKQTVAKRGLFVFLFHGVGGEHNLNVGSEDHRALLRYLKQNGKDIWVAPMVEVANYLKTSTQPKKK